MTRFHPVTFTTINLSRIQQNARYFKTLLDQKHRDLPARSTKRGEPRIMAVVKADAYGHGVVQVGTCVCECSNFLRGLFALVGDR
jgi:alanine racemase